MHRLTSSIIAIVAFALPFASAPAQAQTDLSRWDEPVASELLVSLPGDGTVDGDTLYLPLADQVELRVEALDQFGRRFPQDRLRFEFGFDQNCRGLVELVSASDRSVSLQTGKGAGSCDVLLWLPNNLNVERQLRVVANRKGSGGPVTRPVTGEIDTREELVAASIFRAALGRDPDARWLAEAADQVRRNQTRTLVRSVLDSPEASERRRTVPPETLLHDIYRGLLGRELDASGSRTYMGDMRQGEIDDVILSILGSREFQDRLARELG